MNLIRILVIACFAAVVTGNDLPLTKGSEVEKYIHLSIIAFIRLNIFLKITQISIDEDKLFNFVTDAWNQLIVAPVNTLTQG